MDLSTAYRRTGFVITGAALLLTGCKPDAAVRTGAVVDRGTQTAPQQPAAATVDTSQSGALTGTVLFRGTPPPSVPIDMSMDPACAFAENSSEQVVVANGKLANVYLYIKGAAPSQAPAPGRYYQRRSPTG